MRRLFRFLKRILTKYFELHAKRLLKKHDPKVVAVVGSVGKTSTKLAVAQVLAEKYSVLAHQSSYNSPISLPLSIFNLRVPDRLYNPLAWLGVLLKISLSYWWKYPYEVLVLELGADQPGDITYFLRYIKPYVGVITAVTPEHMEGFGTMEAVLEEEFELAKHAKFVLMNAGDVLLNVKKKSLASKNMRSFGVEKGDYYFQMGFHNIEGIQGQVKMPRNRSIHANLHIIGKHSLYAITAAAGAGDLMKLDKESIRHGLEKVRPVNGRMNPLPGLNGSVIIDDSYNSSPDAAIAAIDTLYTLPSKRKLAVLGSMNELGNYSREAHENVGRWCTKLNFLVTVGDEARQYLVPEAIDSGLGKKKVKSFKSPYRAGSFMKKIIKKGDLVLVKGSQNKIFTEEVTRLLLEDPRDRSKLVRQTEFWQRQKNRQFKDAK